MPDIFIDFYTSTTFNKKKRIAYLRVPAKQCIAREDTKMRPHWYDLRSPYNDNKKKLGSVMASI